MFWSFVLFWCNATDNYLRGRKKNLRLVECFIIFYAFYVRPYCLCKTFWLLQWPTSLNFRIMKAMTPQCLRNTEVVINGKSLSTLMNIMHQRILPLKAHQYLVTFSPFLYYHPSNNLPEIWYLIVWLNWYKNLICGFFIRRRKKIKDYIVEKINIKIGQYVSFSPFFLKFWKITNLIFLNTKWKAHAMT